MAHGRVAGRVAVGVRCVQEQANIVGVHRGAPVPLGGCVELRPRAVAIARLGIQYDDML